jgi:ribose transport system ATP-binding protein
MDEPGERRRPDQSPVIAPDPAPPARSLIRARGLSVHFGSVAALREVDIDVRAGSVHALVGENGAGKSTLMRVLSGAVTPGRGSLEVDGAAVTFATPRDAHRSGIRMIHQELSLVPDLSVAENIFLGAEPSRHGVLQRHAMRMDARAVLAALGEDIDPEAQVVTLSLASREMVEIAKALAAPGRTARPSSAASPGQGDGVARGSGGVERFAVDATRLRVLILDEPTAILSSRETEALFARIAAFAKAGVGIIYCSHRLEEIDALADEVTVLRDGERVAHGPAKQFSRDALIRLMVGRSMEGGARPASAVRRPGATTSDVLRVDRVTTRGVRDVSFAIGVGEIVALVGLVGAGRTELARAVVGADRRTGGDIFVEGVRINPRSPADAARAGLAYVSEDRKASALIPQGSVRMNMTLARLRSFARGRFPPIIDRARERTVAARWVDALRIRISDLDQPVGALSGGNQQKVVLARWLIDGDRPLRVLIVDEPTRGVDVGARSDIYAALRDLASRGTAVVAITSDLEEALAIADRLLVMREGRIVGSLAGGAATATEVAALMVPA